MSPNVGDWLAGIATVALYSFLYKENRVYRFFEHVFVGLAGGYALAMAFSNVRTMGFQKIAQGNILIIVPCILGLLIFSRFVPQYSWLSRYPTALMVGIGAGLSLRGIPGSQIVSQINASIVPLNSLGNIVFVVGLLGVLAYFLFTREQKGWIGGVSQFGRVAMMVSFGATFAATIFDNISLLVGTFYKVFGSWLGIVRF